MPPLSVLILADFIKIHQN